MLKQRHVADFETYVLILYTALSDLTIAPPFIPPIAKTGNVLSFLFFCFKWGRAKGNLLPRTYFFVGRSFGRNARASYFVAVGAWCTCGVLAPV